jgi:pimeloyl-ACP methyl ester carboxylesterase
MKHNMKQFRAIKSLLPLLFTIVITAFSSVVSFGQKIHNIVLVHGAFVDGSGWEGVYNNLVKKGHHVAVVGNPNTGLADDIAATKRVLDRLNGPAILVGHSYGGAIITEAGLDKNVAGLVFVTAFVPDAGETLLQLSQAGPPAVNSGILPPQDGFIWYDKVKFHSGFCADLTRGEAAFMYDAQVPVAASVFVTPVKNAAWKTRPSWYIVATEDQTIPPDGQRFMAKRANAKVVEIKGSHAVFISRAEAVANVIDAAAKEINSVR